jgi:hypothetical protein
MQMMPTMSCDQRLAAEAATSDLSAAVEDVVINSALDKEIFYKVSFLRTNPVKRFHMFVMGF